MAKRAELCFTRAHGSRVECIRLPSCYREGAAAEPPLAPGEGPSVASAKYLKKEVKQMPTTKERILDFLERNPGSTDSEIYKGLHLCCHQRANGAARELEQEGRVRRVKEGGYIRNYLPGQERIGGSKDRATGIRKPDQALGEDRVIEILREWLRRQGWILPTRADNRRGADIIAKKGGRKWVIEAKGAGSRSQARVNYFLIALGQILQRMSDEQQVSYSVAFPDIRQYRSLWERLPGEAKSRIGVSALFVSKGGIVDEVL